MKEIIVYNSQELLNNLDKLSDDTILRYKVNIGDIEFNIVIELAYCKFFCNMKMTLDDTICMYIEGGVMFYRKCYVKTSMISDYIKLINDAKNERELFCAYLLIQNQLYPNDKIFINSKGREKIGIINKPTDRFSGQISYNLIKKDGTIGSKEYLLYGNSESFNYKCLNREYIDFEKLK